MTNHPSEYLERHASDMDSRLLELFQKFYRHGKRSKSELEADSTFYDHITRFRRAVELFAPDDFNPLRPTQDELVEIAFQVDESERYTSDSKESVKKSIKTVYREFEQGKHHEKTEAFTCSAPGDSKTVDETEILSPEEVRNIISHMSHPRDKAFYRCMYEVAAHPGEMLNCSLKDVHLEEEALFIHGDGTHESRKMELHSEGARYLREYLEMHPQVSDPFNTYSDEPLWIKFQGTDCENCGESEIRHRDERYDLECEEYIPEECSEVSYQSMREALKEAKKKSDVERRVAPSYMRKSMLTQVNKESGISTESFRAFARWVPGSSQAQHYVSISNEEVRNIVKETFKGEVEEEQEYVRCQTCSTRNRADGSKVCSNCGRPLDAVKDLELREMQKAVKELTELNQEEIKRIKGEESSSDVPEDDLEDIIEEKISEMVES